MVDHTNSTFKKYSTSNHDDQSSGASPDEDELAMDEDTPQSRMDAQNSNVSNVSNASNGSNASEVTSPSSSQSCSEFDNVHHEVDDAQDGGARIFPTSRTIKEQQRIPAHLNASDEELHLFLRNPPSPPVPFYPSSVRFAPNQSNQFRPSRSGSSPQSQKRRQSAKRRQSVPSAMPSTRLSPQIKCVCALCANSSIV